MKYSVIRCLDRANFYEHTNWLIAAWFYALMYSVSSMAHTIIIKNNQTNQITRVKSDEIHDA